MELAEHLPGGLPGDGDRLGGGEGEIEQQQEVTARRHGSGRRTLRAAQPFGDLKGKIEDLEADDLLLLAALVDLEVVGREPADRNAVADHLDRHLDHDDIGALGVGGLGADRPGQQKEGRGKAKAQGSFHRLTS
jgi:hypothetical protein